MKRFLLSSLVAVVLEAAMIVLFYFTLDIEHGSMTAGIIATIHQPAFILLSSVGVPELVARLGSVVLMVLFTAGLIFVGASWKHQRNVSGDA